MVIAPERDVVRVEEIAGPRGGRTLVLHLSCGCFLTRSSKAPPPKRARCTPCAVMRARPDLAVVVVNRDELELLCRLVDVYRGAVHEVGAARRRLVIPGQCTAVRSGAVQRSAALSKPRFSL